MKFFKYLVYTLYCDKLRLKFYFHYGISNPFKWENERNDKTTEKHDFCLSVDSKLLLILEYSP